MSKKEKESKKKMYTGIIKFNQINNNGNMYKSGCIKEKDLLDLKVNGEIIDYEINGDGVKVIKEFKLDSISIPPIYSIK